MLIRHNTYLTPEQYRAHIGYASISPIYRMLQEGLLEGAVKINDRWIIPKTAIPTDRRMKTGKYAGWRLRYPPKEKA